MSRNGTVKGKIAALNEWYTNSVIGESTSCQVPQSKRFLRSIIGVGSAIIILKKKNTRMKPGTFGCWVSGARRGSNDLMALSGRKVLEQNAA